MAYHIKHTKNITIADDFASATRGEIVPSDWIANHKIVDGDGVEHTLEEILSEIPTSSGGNISTVTVAATGALGAANADYSCDGTADDVQINAAITEIDEAGGGVVLLSAGTFTLAHKIQMKSGVRLIGMGSDITIIVQGAAEIGIDALDNTYVNYPRGDVTIEGITLIMPSGASARDGIQAGSGITIKDYKYGGGSITTWGIHMINSYGMIIEDIGISTFIQNSPYYSFDSNGIWLEANHELENWEAVNYGDGSIKNAGLVLPEGDDNIGLKISADTESGYWSDMYVEHLVVNSWVTDEGCGIDIDKMIRSLFNQIDVEEINASNNINLSRAHGITFNSYIIDDYIHATSAPVQIDSDSDTITFIGYQDPGMNVDLQPYSLKINWIRSAGSLATEQTIPATSANKKLGGQTYKQAEVGRNWGPVLGGSWAWVALKDDNVGSGLARGDFGGIGDLYLVGDPANIGTDYPSVYFPVGAIMKNSSITAGGTYKWICVTAGTGTGAVWKALQTIAA